MVERQRGKREIGEIRRQSKGSFDVFVGRWSWSMRLAKRVLEVGSFDSRKALVIVNLVVDVG
jgi:hypothetical protein